MLRGKNILLISPEPWNHIFVSKHHYAIHLAQRGNKVFFLNPPGGITTIVPTEYSDVHEVSYTGFPRGLRYYPRFLQRFIIAHVYCRLLKLCRCDFDLVWSFDNSVFYDFSALPSTTLAISHIVDSNQDFQTRKAASSADFCFCVSEAIRSHLLKCRENVFKINHGFHPTQPIMLDAEEKYHRRFKAVYAGNLLIPYIDWALLTNVIDAHPEVDFIFLGPYVMEGEWHVLQVLAARDNVFFPGRVSNQVLAGYYDLADVLLIVYQEEYQRNQVSNTHKMMEYLGSGKMIVATYTAEYADLQKQGVILMSDRNVEFPALFDKVLAELDHWNNNVLQAARRVFALDNTYEKQIQRIEEIIFKA